MENTSVPASSGIERLKWAGVCLILALGAALLLWRSSSAPTQGAGKALQRTTDVRSLVLEPDSVDFGELALGETREQIVMLRNRGADSVQILSEISSCGCLRAELGERILAPGDGSPVRLVFTGVPGRRTYQATLTLVSDERGPSRYDIAVAARVRFEILVEPEVLAFGKLEKGSERTMEAVVHHIEARPFQIREVRSGSPEFRFTWSPTGDGKGHRIQVVARALRAGTISDQAVIVTEPSFAASSALLVSVECEGDIRVSPPVAAAKWGTDGKVGVMEVILERKAGEAFTIQSVRDSRELGLTHRTEALGPGRWKLFVQFGEDISRGAPVGELLIQTSAAAEPLPLPWRFEGSAQRPPRRP